MKIKSIWGVLFCRLEFWKVNRILSRFEDDNIGRIFDDKRVAIIGPAESAMSESNGDYIDKYDLIVRMNKGYQLLTKKENHKYIGSRTDILFSRLDDRECIDPETFDYELLKEQKIKRLISYWRTEPFGYYHRILLFVNNHTKLFGGILAILSLKKYSEILSTLDYSKPTVGYITLYTILKSCAKEIYITGLTFYDTESMKGYRDELTKDLQLSDFKKKEYGHKPKKEYELFKAMYIENKEKIVLDKFLEEKINNINPIYDH